MTLEPYRDSTSPPQDSARSSVSDDDRCKRCGMTRAAARSQRVNSKRCTGDYWQHFWKRPLGGTKVAYDEAVMWLQRLAGWGWGENAPDNAIQDWNEARAWLNEHGQA